MSPFRKTTIQKALTLVGAAYLLNCGSTVFVEMVEGDNDSGSGATVGSTGAGMGGMGGSIAFAKNVVFTTYELPCLDDVYAIVPAGTFEPTLWPLVQMWSSPKNGPSQELLDVSPGSTSYRLDNAGRFYFDNGDMGVICGHAPTVTVVVPNYVNE